MAASAIICNQVIELTALGDMRWTKLKTLQFWLRTSLGIQYHQVKRQLTGIGRWSLPLLDEKGILSTFYNKLYDPSTTCVFVSMHTSRPLDELAYRAR